MMVEVLVFLATQASARAVGVESRAAQDE
jgi:hypothetical protein